MKFASYRLDGTESFGLVADQGVIDAPTHLGDVVRDLRGAIADGALSRIAADLVKRPATLPFDAVDWLPVIPRPDKIVCAGVNYRSHASETGRALPIQPSMFARFQDTLIGHDAAILRPHVSHHLDFEGELAVIIGKPGRNIPAEQALDFVAGYTCFNDGSLRDYQKFSVTAGKNFPSTGALGPWMVTADEITDPAALTLVTRVNGTEMQRTGTAEMIHSVPSIIAFVSRFTPLEPGDVIATGTPEGVGHKRDPQVWLNAGDVVEVEISGIGLLRNSVRAEDRP